MTGESQSLFRNINIAYQDLEGNRPMYLRLQTLGHEAFHGLQELRQFDVNLGPLVASDNVTEGVPFASLEFLREREALLFGAYVGEKHLEFCLNNPDQYPLSHQDIRERIDAVAMERLTAYASNWLIHQIYPSFDPNDTTIEIPLDTLGQIFAAAVTLDPESPTYRYVAAPIGRVALIHRAFLAFEDPNAHLSLDLKSAVSINGLDALEMPFFYRDLYFAMADLDKQGVQFYLNRERPKIAARLNLPVPYSILYPEAATKTK